MSPDGLGMSPSALPGVTVEGERGGQAEPAAGDAASRHRGHGLVPRSPHKLNGATGANCTTFWHAYALQNGQ